MSLLRRMTEAGLVPDLQIYSAVISACGIAGKWQRAIGVLRWMDYEGKIKPNLYCINAAMSACEKGSAWVEAIALFEQMKSNGIRPDFVTINSLIIALDKSGQRELADTIYREAVADQILSHWKWNQSENLDDGRLVRMMDLHQYSVSMARIAVSHVIESMLLNDNDSYDIDAEPMMAATRMSPTPHDKSKDLVIITGKGRDNDGVLGPIIMQVLRDLGMTGAKMDDTNKGRIIVSSKELNEFVKLRKW